MKRWPLRRHLRSKDLKQVVRVPDGNSLVASRAVVVLLLAPSGEARDACEADAEEAAEGAGQASIGQHRTTQATSMASYICMDVPSFPIRVLARWWQKGQSISCGASPSLSSGVTCSWAAMLPETVSEPRKLLHGGQGHSLRRSRHVYWRLDRCIGFLLIGGRYGLRCMADIVLGLDRWGRSVRVVFSHFGDFRYPSTD